MTPVESPAVLLVDRLVEAHGKKHAHKLLDEILDQLSIVDLAALAYDWSAFWARPKQVFPAHDWRSCGFLTARGTGKTTACGAHIVEEIIAGRAMQVGMAAQNEDKTVAVQVASLIESSPPWFRPQWLASSRQLVWPNGAVAWAFTPEVPGAIRSPNLHLCWLSEVQSWPASTRQEAYLNFQFATRLGYARTIWDATPKMGHPMLKAFVARESADHVVIRGTIHENARNLGRGVIRNLESEFGGTRAGREELLGELLDESESALVKQAWIDSARRSMPERMTRRIVSIDPAITERKGSDNTGIVLAGLDVDGQVIVFGDHSGKMPPSAWAEKTIDAYLEHKCDCAIVERNKGGDMLRTVLKAFCRDKDLSIVLVGEGEKPRHTQGVLHVKEVFARGAKEDRARPAATAYERGRVSHVKGVNLASLEETLTTWEPSPSAKSPGDLDALAHAVNELLGLTDNKPDGRAAMVGITDAQKVLSRPLPSSSLLQAFGQGLPKARI